MAAVDSTARNIGRNYSIEELQAKALELRFLCMKMLEAASTDAPQDLLSHIEIATVLYFKHLRYDPVHPLWGGRDRIYWSDYFEELVLRLLLSKAGYLSLEKALSNGSLSPDLGLEAQPGPYGYSLGLAAGDALSARLEGMDYQVFCMMGEPEQLHGGVWDAAGFAAENQLGNLIGVVVRGENSVELLADKYASFGWHVILIDGNSIGEIHTALLSIDPLGKYPTVLIAETKPVEIDESSVQTGILDNMESILGSGLSSWEETDQTILYSPSRRVYRWNGGKRMKVKLSSSGTGIRNIINSINGKGDIVVLEGDQSSAALCSEAAGLCRGGKIPTIILQKHEGAGSCFQQISDLLCRNQLKAGIIDLSETPGFGYETGGWMSALYGVDVELPCDALEMEKAVRLTQELKRTTLIRGCRKQSPVVTRSESCYRAGVANVIRYREIRDLFVDAFEVSDGWSYVSENEDLCLIAAGDEVAESMRAAFILKEEYGCETRVINVHSLHPLDDDTIRRGADETGYILIVERWNNSGFGNLIAGVFYRMKTGKQLFEIDSIGSGESDISEMITAEMIVLKALYFMEQKKRNH